MLHWAALRVAVLRCAVRELVATFYRPLRWDALRCAALVLVTTCISMEPFTHTLRCAELVETFFCFY